jgi:hypothetical protein
MQSIVGLSYFKVELIIIIWYLWWEINKHFFLSTYEIEKNVLDLKNNFFSYDLFS